MAEDKSQEPEEREPSPETPSNDEDDLLLRVLASALVPIFFRRRR